jgi:anti-sigma factor RsiW
MQQMKICNLFDSYRDGELDAGQRRAFEAHLPACDRCRLTLSLLDNLSESLSREPGLPGGLPERIAARAFQENASWDSGVTLWLRPKPAWLAFAIALVLLTVIVLSPTTTRQGDLYSEYETVYKESIGSFQLHTDDELMRWLERRGGTQ